MMTQTSFIADLATIVPVAVGTFVFFTLAALILGARLVHERADGSSSFFSFSFGGDGDSGCGSGCGGGCGG